MTSEEETEGVNVAAGLELLESERSKRSAAVAVLGIEESNELLVSRALFQNPKST